MAKMGLIGNWECMFPFLKRNPGFLATGSCWLFVGGGLDGKHAVARRLAAAGVGSAAHLCRGCRDFSCSCASFNFSPKLFILNHSLSGLCTSLLG